jgi:hypothetical protein
VKNLTTGTVDILKEVRAEVEHLPQQKRRDFLLNGLKLAVDSTVAAVHLLHGKFSI